MDGGLFEAHFSPFTPRPRQAVVVALSCAYALPYWSTYVDCSGDVCQSRRIGLWQSCSRTLGAPPSGSVNCVGIDTIDAGQNFAIELMLARICGAIAVLAAIIPFITHVLLTLAKSRGRWYVLQRQRKLRLRQLAWIAGIVELSCIAVLGVGMGLTSPEKAEGFGPCEYLAIGAWVTAAAVFIFVDRKMAATKAKEARQRVFSEFDVMSIRDSTPYAPSHFLQPLPYTLGEAPTIRGPYYCPHSERLALGAAGPLFLQRRPTCLTELLHLGICKAQAPLTQGDLLHRLITAMVPLIVPGGTVQWTWIPLHLQRLLQRLRARAAPCSRRPNLALTRTDPSSRGILWQALHRGGVRTWLFPWHFPSHRPLCTPPRSCLAHPCQCLPKSRPQPFRVVCCRGSPGQGEVKHTVNIRIGNRRRVKVLETLRALALLMRQSLKHFLCSQYWVRHRRP